MLGCRAQELYQAGEKKIGTDESKFNSILCSQSYEQLRAVFQEYKALSKKGLDQVIKSEMSGDLENALLAICECTVVCWRYVEYKPCTRLYL